MAEDDEVAPVFDIRDKQAAIRERLRAEARELWKESELAAAVAKATEMLADLMEEEATR